MKNNYGDLWAETLPNGRVNIGFTKQCINGPLTECFHVLPADVRKVKSKSPLLVLETNDGLQSLQSPIAGEIVFFNDKARNFPDRITDDDIIMTVVLESQLEKERTKKPPKEKVEIPYVDWNQPRANFFEVRQEGDGLE